MPLPVPNRAGASDALPAASSEGMAEADPGAAEQLGGQQVGQVGRVDLDLGQPEQPGRRR